MTFLWLEEVTVTATVAVAVGIILAYADVFPGIDHIFIMAGAVATAFVLQTVYDLILFPYMLSPLRKLPTVPVCLKKQQCLVIFPSC
jgi:hypothetical protein